MASPTKQHCANCIGALSFPIVPVHLRWQRSTLRTSGFADDVMFAHHGPWWAYRNQNQRDRNSLFLVWYVQSSSPGSSASRLCWLWGEVCYLRLPCSAYEVVNCSLRCFFAPRLTQTARPKNIVVYSRLLTVRNSNIIVVVIYDPCIRILCLQCFDAVGWVAGRASGL